MVAHARIAGINGGRIAQTVLSNQLDLTYVTVDASILAAAEASIGLVVVCAPTLGPIFAPSRYFDRQTLQRKPYTRWPKKIRLSSNRGISTLNTGNCASPPSPLTANGDDFEMLVHNTHNEASTKAVAAQPYALGGSEALGKGKVEVTREFDVYTTPRDSERV